MNNIVAQNQVNNAKERISRSQSLKGTQSRKDREETKEKAVLLVPTSLKQKITSVLYPERDTDIKDHAHSARAAPAPSLYSALNSCLYLPTQGMSPEFHFSFQLEWVALINFISFHLV